MGMQIIIPGAAGVVIKCTDGVVLGNDRMAVWGYTITNKSVKKVFTITDNIGMAAWGLIGDYQILVKIMRAQANLYELDAGDKISTQSMAKLVSNYLYSRKMFPLYTNLVIAGVDNDGPKLYTIDAIGSVLPDDYGAVGTGMLMSMGILEAEYSPSIEVKEGAKLVEKTILNAIKRDAMSGCGVDIITIKKDGFLEEFIEVKKVPDS